METGSLNSLYSSMCHGECSGEGPSALLLQCPGELTSAMHTHIHTSTVQTNYHTHPFGDLVNILHGTPLLNTAERDAKPPYS